MQVAPSARPQPKLAPPPVIRDQLSWSAIAGTSLTADGASGIDGIGYDRAAVRKLVLSELQPPPPASVQREELQLMHAIKAGRTPERTQRARYLANNGEEKLWDAEFRRLNEIAPIADAKAGHALLEEALAAAGSISRSAKQHYQRPRPFSVDPTLEPVVRRPSGTTSYPSSHSAHAFAGATVLGALWPTHADTLADTAREVAFSRTYGGVHYPSDIAAGTFIGAAAGAAVIAGALHGDLEDAA